MGNLVRLLPVLLNLLSKVKVKLPKGSVQSFNDALGLKITNAVGTMWCAYIFCAISLTSLPSTLAQHSVNLDVQWVAQTFFQLVLLSVIMVGQNVQAKRAAEHAEQLASLHEKVTQTPLASPQAPDAGRPQP